MKEVWNTTDNFWDLKHLSQVEDTWKWSLNPSGQFSTKILFLIWETRGIWKDNHPKKKKKSLIKPSTLKMALKNVCLSWPYPLGGAHFVRLMMNLRTTFLFIVSLLGSFGTEFVNPLVGSWFYLEM